MSRLTDKQISNLIEDIRKIHSPTPASGEGSFAAPTGLGHVKNKDTMNIEKNIPMPDRKRNGTIATTLRSMSVGDSIVLPKGKDIGWRSSAKRLSMKVASRKISDTECRLWRVA